MDLAVHYCIVQAAITATALILCGLLLLVWQPVSTSRMDADQLLAQAVWWQGQDVGADLSGSSVPELLSVP